MDIGERLKRLRTEREMSGYALAVAAGLTPTQVKTIEDGGNRNPGVTVIRKLADALGVSLDELFGRSLPASAGQNHDAPRPESTVPVPLVAIAAGGPPIAFEEIPGETYSILRHLYQKNRYVIKIVGDSMYPTFWDNDLLLVEPVEKVKDGTVAVVLVNNESTVTRVYRLTGGGFLLKSDASTHPPIEVDAADVKVTGRVLRIVDGVRP